MRSAAGVPRTFIGVAEEDADDAGRTAAFLASVPIVARGDLDSRRM